MDRDNLIDAIAYNFYMATETKEQPFMDKYHELKKEYDMEKETKKMFSLNCAAYTIVATDLFPKVEWNDETQTIYFVFPECSGVSTAIRQFKTQRPTVDLMDFLKSIKQLRTSMAAVRQQHMTE